MALNRKTRDRIAVTPWNEYAGTIFTLNASALPRNTSAITYRIQVADMSQASPAAIHHNIVHTSS